MAKPEAAVSLGDQECRLSSGESCTVGRSTSSDLVAADRRVSRSHVRVAFDGTVCTISDMGSTRGMYVDGMATAEHRVTADAVVHLADANGPALRVRVSSNTASRGGRRAIVVVAAVSALVVVAIVTRLIPGPDSPAVDGRLVTVVATSDAQPDAIGGGVIVDGRRGLVLTGARSESDSYRVVLPSAMGDTVISAVEVASDADVALLRLVGLDSAPVLAAHLSDLGSSKIDASLPSAVDIVTIQSVGSGEPVVVRRTEIRPSGDAADRPAEWDGSRDWEALVDGNTVVGFARTSCEDSDRVRLVGLGELVQVIDSSDPLSSSPVAGPAPYRSAGGPVGSAQQDSCEPS